jgi:hypothetical protein
LHDIPHMLQTILAMSSFGEDDGLIAWKGERGDQGKCHTLNDSGTFE